MRIERSWRNTEWGPRSTDRPWVTLRRRQEPPVCALLRRLYGASGVADYLVASERSSARRARYVCHAHATTANSSVRRIHLNIVLEYPGREGLHTSRRIA